MPKFRENRAGKIVGRRTIAERRESTRITRRGRETLMHFGPPYVRKGLAMVASEQIAKTIVEANKGNIKTAKRMIAKEGVSTPSSSMLFKDEATLKMIQQGIRRALVRKEILKEDVPLVLDLLKKRLDFEHPKTPKCIINADREVLKAWQKENK